MTADIPRGVDMKLEVVVIPVSDVARARAFYEQLGFTRIGTAKAHVHLGGIDKDEVFLERSL